MESTISVVCVFRWCLLHNFSVTRARVRRVGGSDLRVRQRRSSLHEHHRVLRLPQPAAQRVRSEDRGWRSDGRAYRRHRRRLRHDHHLRGRHGVGVQG